MTGEAAGRRLEGEREESGADALLNATAHAANANANANALSQLGAKAGRIASRGLVDTR